MFGTNHVAAQDKGVSFSGGSDLVSSYYWRGVKESGPALQPTLTMTAGNFSVTAWGSIDFSDSGYKEMDLTLAYQLGPVTLSVADLYWTGHDDDRYFIFDSHSPPTASRKARAGSYRKNCPSRCRGTRSCSAPLTGTIRENVPMLPISRWPILSR